METARWATIGLSTSMPTRRTLDGVVAASRGRRALQPFMVLHRVTRVGTIGVSANLGFTPPARVYIGLSRGGLDICTLPRTERADIDLIFAAREA